MSRPFNGLAPTTTSAPFFFVWQCGTMLEPLYYMNKSMRLSIFERVKSLAFPLGKYVVVGSGSMEAHGLRNADDVDIVVLPTFFQELLESNWTLDEAFKEKWGWRRLKKNDVEVHERIMILNKDKVEIDAKEVIDTADIIENLPFQSLESLLRVKRNAVREKDAEDVQLLEKYLSTK